MRRLVQWLAGRLPSPRIIYDGEGRSPYLSRYYLLGRPRMPDGSQPFDEFGDVREGCIWASGWGLYLHRFHRSDKDRELHNHPWKWAVSLVLAGGYREERRQGSIVVEREIKPGSLNFIGHGDYHRVDLMNGDAWSLFLAGPKVSSWGFWDRDDGAFTPWRQFLARVRSAAPRPVTQAIPGTTPTESDPAPQGNGGRP